MEANKKRKPYKKPITKQNPQDALNSAVSYLQTVDYNNDTSITDLVPTKKLETTDEENDEEDGLQVIKTVNSINITNDDNDEVNFIKKTPLNPRDRLKRLSKNQLIRNQTDQKKYAQILPQKKLVQDNKNQSKDIEYIKNVPLHPRERLKRKKKTKQEPEVQDIKTLL